MQRQQWHQHKILGYSKTWLEYFFLDGNRLGTDSRGRQAQNETHISGDMCQTVGCRFYYIFKANCSNSFYSSQASKTLFSKRLGAMAEK